VKDWLDKLKELVYSEKVGRITLDFNVAENVVIICKYPLPKPEYQVMLPISIDKK